MVDNIISTTAVYEHLEVFRTGDCDPNSFLGTSSAAAKIRRRVEHARKQPLRPVLITGPSGSGKELVAELITRSPQDMISVNCAAVPEALIESEFFGHALGAFTGARKSHKGFFEQANGGDLFLDEIGDSPLEL